VTFNRAADYSFWGPEIAIKPAQCLRLKRVSWDLGLMNEPALGTSQGPIFKTATPRSDVLDSHLGLALRTARPLGLAWRQPIGELSVRHSGNLLPLCPGVDLNRQAVSSIIPLRGSRVALAHYHRASRSQRTAMDVIKRNGPSAGARAEADMI
jgi:hypothetical protein